MTKKEFLVTPFYVDDDGEIIHGASSLFKGEASKDICIEALSELYKALQVQYHIYVEELIDGMIFKRIQHISSNNGEKS